MPLISRQTFEMHLEGRTCCDFIHPWYTSCIRACIMQGLHCSWGSLKFASIAHLVPLLIKWRNIRRRHMQEYAINTIRMSLGGSIFGCLYVASSCLILKVLGRFDYIWSSTIPGAVAGLCIFALSEYRRNITITAFTCSALQGIISYLYGNGICKRSILREMMLFMVSNGGLLYFIRLWKENYVGKHMPQLWFYAPTVRQRPRKEEIFLENCDITEICEDTNYCSHTGSCVDSTIKDCWNYFCCGTIIEVIRVFITNFNILAKNPALFRKYIFDKKNLRLAIFATSYVMLYRATSCILCQKRKIDPEIHTFIAGMISGLSYYLQPNLPLCLAAFVNFIHISWKFFDISNRYFRGFQVSILFFILVNGFMCSWRVIAPDYCPKFFKNCLRISSNGRSDEMIKALYAVAVPNRTKI